MTHLLNPDWKPCGCDGDWREKVWGRCRTLFRDCHVEIVEAEIVAGGYSSVHKHLNKDNTFIVLSGELEVELYPGSLRPQKHVLTARLNPLENCSLTVVPHVSHKFVALQASRLIEVYRSQYGKPIDPDDIVRHSDGGVRSQ